MAVLTKDQILTADDLKTETVAVPEWGGEVLVSEMTAAARDEWEGEVFDDAGKLINDNWRAKLLAACLVDENGNRLFKPCEITSLGGKSRAAVDRVYKVARDLNGLNKEKAEGN